MKNNFKLLTILIIAFITNACSKSFESYPSQIVTENGIFENSPVNNGSQQNSNLQNENSINSKTSQQFCSPLKFDQVKWDTRMTLLERRSMAIGLSISGSFEGQNGWNNITNNFDGQGLSAGLLNQTLGTGSLQPLLSEMELNNATEFKSSFSSQNYASISGMLSQWRGQKSLKTQSLTLQDEEDQIPIRPIELEATQFMKMMTSQNSYSVNWAVQNLYLANKNFKPDWKTELMTLLNKGSYISLQVVAAQKIHNTALKYVARVGLNDLRTYLLMFDILVQNGSIKETRFVEWENFIKANNITNSTKALKALVEIRLKDTNPKWVPDVRSRKYALIDGLGTVHGRNLNLPKSYCYQLNDQIK